MIELVIIETIHDSLDNLEAVKHFNDSVALKSSTYKRIYGDNVISVASTDYISTHIVFYDKELSDGPILAYQLVSDEQVERFKLEHPVSYLIKKGGGSKLAFESYESFKESCSGKTLYMTAVARDKVLKDSDKISELVLASFCRYFKDKRMKGAFALPGLKIKSNHKASSVLGFKDLTWDNKCYDPHTNQNILLMSLKDFPKEASLALQSTEEIWRNRKVYEKISV